jgi:hypothetical protein
MLRPRSKPKPVSSETTISVRRRPSRSAATVTTSVIAAIPTRPAPITAPAPATDTPASVSAIARTTPIRPTDDDRRNAAA